jgi:hypothetical protein
MFMLMGLLTGLFAAFAPTASAVSVPGDATGSITGFEIEGNQTSDGQGLDWQALVGSDTLTVVSDDPSGNTDSGLQGSSKENDPSGWTCDTGGSNPPKNNILHAAINDRFSPTGAFLDLAYVREGQTGNAHVNFEFNQEPITGNCPLVGRTTGDLLLLFNFPGGAGRPTSPPSSGTPRSAPTASGSTRARLRPLRRPTPAPSPTSSSRTSHQWRTGSSARRASTSSASSGPIPTPASPSEP